MGKTTEAEVAILKQKVSNAKTTVTRSIKEATQALQKFEIAVQNNDHKKVALAKTARELSTKVEDNYQKLAEQTDDYNNGITELINEGNMNSSLEKINKNNTELEKYQKEITNFQERNDQLISDCFNPEIYETNSTQSSRNSSRERNRNTSSERTKDYFKACSELRPSMLGKDHSLKEIKNWVSKFSDYLTESYNQREIPATALYRHVRNNVDEIWMRRLKIAGYSEGNDMKQLKEAFDKDLLIRFPLHTRRMKLISLKHDSEDPEEFIETIDEASLDAQYDTMTRESFVIHLSAHLIPEIHELAMEHLEKYPQGELAKFKVKVQSHSAKTNSTTTDAGKKSQFPEKSCYICGKRGHIKRECKMKCKFCNVKNSSKEGHKQAFCPKNPNRLDKKEKIEHLKNKNKKEREQKPKEQAKTANVEENESTEDSSFMEDSPQGKQNERHARLAFQQACRVKFQEDSDSEYAITGWNKGLRVKVQETVKKVSNPRQAPKLHGTVAPRPNETGEIEEDFVCDTGASINIINEKICKQNNIRIRKRPGLDPVIDAQGNFLKIVGECTFYCRMSIHQFKPKILTAVVLAGNNTDREILLDFTTLKNWNIIHKQFPLPLHLDPKDFSRVLKAAYPEKQQKRKVTIKNKSKKKNLKEPSDECKKLRKEVMEAFPDNFREELRKEDRLNIEPVRLELDENRNIKPTHVTTSHETPLHLVKASNQEFKRLLAAGILEKVEHATEWCSRGFFVAKPGSDPIAARFVTNFRGLNKALKRPLWPTESSSQLLRRINPKARYFAAFDLVSGYHQVPLHEEDRDLCAVATNYGKYRYTTLGQGLVSSNDLFNMVTDGNLRSEENVLKNVDDIAFATETIEELREMIYEFMEMAATKNLKLSPKKFQIGEQIKFGGVIISSEVIKNKHVTFISPSSEKIDALLEIEEPTSKKELQIFCGLVSSLQAWYPATGLLIPGLRKMTAHNTPFVWNADLTEEFKNIKEYFKNGIKLSPMDPNKKIYLIVDGASSVGVGFILTQMIDESDETKGMRIIQCNSTRLTPAQLQYSPVEIELLSVHYALRSTDYYCRYAPEIIILGDCKAVGGLLEKELSDIKNARLARMLEEIMIYNLTFKHVSGRDNVMADALSRLCRKTYEAGHFPISQPRILENLETAKSAASTKESADTADPLVKRLGEMAAEDLEYMEMVACVENNTQTKHLHQESELKLLEGIRQDLGTITLSNGTTLIVKDGREILIPKGAREDLIKKLHLTHGSDSLMLRLCENKFFWPQYKRDLKEAYTQCEQCQLNAIKKMQSKKEIHSNDFVTMPPGEEIHVDYAQYGSENFFIMVDRATGFLQTKRTKDQTTDSAIMALKEWSYTYGKMMTIRSDGGPCFRKSFTEAMKEEGIDHKTSSSYNPESNSNAERGVRSLKHVLKRNKKLSDLQIKELVFAINSHKQREGTGSPAQRFFKRTPRDHLPNSRQKETDSEEMMKNRTNKQEKLTNKPSRQSKDEFKEGDNVRIFNIKTKLWDIKGSIVSIRHNDVNKSVSFNIETDKGKMLNRHKKFLRHLPKSPVQNQPGSQSDPPKWAAVDPLPKASKTYKTRKYKKTNQ